MKLPEHVLEEFREAGRKGGRARARALGPEGRRRIARHASVVRWTRERFGAPSFGALGLPGGDLVDRGLADAAAEAETVPSLLVAIAAPRLRREGVPVPRVEWSEPELRCYRMLEAEHGELAHARYLALLDQVDSFACACRLVRVRGRRA